MKHNGTMLGLWIWRLGPTPQPANTLLARVEDELYVLTFSSAVRAHECSRALGAEGTPFYVCSANIKAVVADARESGARGFIVDYEADRARFASAHPLPAGDDRASPTPR